MRQGLTVLGNVAVDRVDGNRPSPGGCPVFALEALKDSEIPGRIVTCAHPRDASLFTDLTTQQRVPVDLFDAEQTNEFRLWYRGDDRVLEVDTVGHCWSTTDIDRAAIDTTWVHVAPLLRNEFGHDALARLADGGRRVSYDGQGLVREPGVGAVKMSPAFDRSILRYLSVLKLAEDEGRAIAGDQFSLSTAAALGVEEILITRGSNGCDVYAYHEMHHVPPPRKVLGVHSTGAGDAFTVAYVAARAMELDRVPAATYASNVVVKMLEQRKAADAATEQAAAV